MALIDLPNQVLEVIEKLNSHTYNAYIVGKCVRELIVDKNAIDYDIITNASMDRIARIFDSYTVIEDRFNQGEIIIAVLGMAILISPYRKGFYESGYAIYTDNITEDLARRDFSFNAIAYHPTEGFVDPFGGIACLKGEKRIVAQVGEVYAPVNDLLADFDENGFISVFERNPVSILQALGYYATGDYIISDSTANSLLFYKSNVNLISQNDLRVELSWAIRGKRVTTVLDEFKEIFIELIPEFIPMLDFNQNRIDHSYDMYSHTTKSVGFASPILTLRYAMLFHSLGKPDCHSLDAKGRGHFYGHSERSRIYAERIMTRLGFKDEDIKEVCFLIKNHDLDLSLDRRSIKLTLRQMPPDKLKLLLQLKYADLRAKSEEFEGAAMQYKRIVDMVNEITALKECYSIQQLAINRYDLIQKGVVKTDAEADSMLERLLDVVLDSPSLNSRIRLLDIAEKSTKVHNIKT